MFIIGLLYVIVCKVYYRSTVLLCVMFIIGLKCLVELMHPENKGLVINATCGIVSNVYHRSIVCFIRGGL